MPSHTGVDVALSGLTVTVAVAGRVTGDRLLKIMKRHDLPSGRKEIMGKDVFVVRHGNGWAVRRPGTDRVSKAFETKAPAFDYGRNMARAGHGELRVQNLNGQFGTCNSYGHDSCPPHDKNR